MAAHYNVLIWSFYFELYKTGYALEKRVNEATSCKIEIRRIGNWCCLRYDA